MRILVVCGAGASSTFVALRLRRAAMVAGLALDVSAGTESTIPNGLDGIAAVLVGPHLEAELPRIRDHAALRGVRVVLLPRDVFTDLDGSRTLELLRASDVEPEPG